MTGWRFEVIHPFFFQPMIHWVIPWRTYWLSVVSRTWQAALRVRSPMMAAISSIRLLVVSRKPPEISLR